jgi:HAE1 family hydrophobic/amphiphilic exporter-1
MKKFEKINSVGKFARFFVENYQISIIFLIILLVGGLLGLSKLPREGMPKVEIPYVMINTAYPGAASQTTEEKVTNLIESATKEIENVKNIESSSLENFSSVVITFEAKTDVAKNIEEVRRKVENVKEKLPKEAENPEVSQIDATGISILANVVGPYNLSVLTKNAEILKKELEEIDGIKNIDILGGTERKISISLDFQKLNASGVSLNQISEALSASNISFPGGTLKEDDKNIPIVIESRFKSKEDIGNVAIEQNLGRPILIKDVAEISDKTETGDIVSHTGYKKDNVLISNESVSLTINATEKTDLIKLSDKVRDKIKTLENDKFDKDVKGLIVYDTADDARQQIGDLVGNAWQSLIIIIVILFIFISLRSSLIVALIIPLSLLFVFLIFNFTDFTLNTITLFSLVLTLGMLVDNAIIIVERIQHNLQKGYSKKDSAIKSVSDLGGAIISATLTTILAFIPIAMMGGITGEFIKYIPYTVIAALSGSLLIALTLTPFLGKVFMRLSRREKEKLKKKGSAEWRIVEIYAKKLSSVIDSGWKKAVALVFVGILFGLSLYLPVKGLVKVNLWPEEKDMNFFQVNLKYPKGTSVKTKNEIAKEAGFKIEELCREDSEVNDVMVSYAPLSLYGGFIASLDSNTLIVQLTEMRQRKITSSDIIAKLREKEKEIKGAEIEVKNFTMGPPTSEYPVEVQIAGDNLENLKKAASDLEKFLKESEGVKLVINSAEEKKEPQIEIEINKEKLNQVGLPTIQVVQIVRSLFQPEKIGEYFDTKSNKNVDIELESKNASRNIEDVKNIMVAAKGSNQIKLKDVAEVKEIMELKKIDHFNTERFVEIKASVNEGIDASEINKKITDYFSKEKLVNFGLDENAITFRGEFEEEENAFDDFGLAFAPALILIFAVLVFQFKSFIQSFIIMLAIPLSMIGVFIGLFVTSNPISFLGLLGIVALTGIVVNDSIVLIDRFNSLKKNGHDLKYSVVEGTKSRVRPVLSTSITIIGGILTLTITISFWEPLGVALISGLITSTILTLLVIPIIYYLVNQMIEKWKKKREDLEV